MAARMKQFQNIKAAAGNAPSVGSRPQSTITTQELPSEASSIIAHSPTASARPSTAASSASSPTNIQSRKAVCTHVHLQRIYGPYKCHHCMRVPRLGWVYRCIQDLGDDLVGFNHCSDDNFTAALQRRLQQESEAQIQEPSAFASEYVQAVPVDPDNPPGAWEPTETSSNRFSGPVATLKPWVQKLADSDFYTDDQLTLLNAQRQNVLSRISQTRFLRPLTKTDLQDVTISDSMTLLKQGKYMRPVEQPSLYGSSSLRSCTLAPYWQVPPATAETQSDPDSLQSAQSQPIQTRQSLRKVHSVTPAGGLCTYQTCSTCRPASRDRSWQCLDPSHYAGDNVRLPDPSIDNRLVSHPDLIYSAHQKVFHPEEFLAASGIYTEDDFYDDDYISGYESSEISPDISSGASLEGTPTSSQFDENRGWDAPNQSLYRPRPTALRRTSSMDPRLLRSSRDMENMDMTGGLTGLGIEAAGKAGTEAGVTTDQATQDAGDASGTDRHHELGGWFVRPGAEAALSHWAGESETSSNANANAAAIGLSQKASEEVIVPDGVAVTEEAVAASEADIIMHV